MLLSEKIKFEQRQAPVVLTKPSVYFNPPFMCGIEIEVENCRDAINDNGYWGVKADGSLRNNGIEFVSRPLIGAAIDEAVNHFWDKELRDNWSFSQRTSIHVHVNAMDMTFEQLSSLLFLYCAVEEMLFDFAGQDRVGSIFCIPLTQTVYPTTLIHHIMKYNASVLSTWEKYSALNLSRLKQIGTVEFRQFPGTRDKAKFIYWLRIIQALFQYVRNHSLDQVLHLLRNGDEFSLIREVFPSDIEAIFRPKDTRRLCKRGLTLVRTGVASTEVIQELQSNLDMNSPYNQFCQKGLV